MCNSLSAEGAKIIGEALKDNTSVHNLDLVSCFSLSLLFCFKASCLRCLQTLELTCLQGENDLGDNGAKFIGEALKVNTSVQALDLVSCFSLSFFCFVSKLHSSRCLRCLRA